MVAVLACVLGALGISIGWNIVVAVLNRYAKGYRTHYEDGTW